MTEPLARDGGAPARGAAAVSERRGRWRACGSVDMILVLVRIAHTKGGAIDSRSAAPLLGLGRAQVPRMVARFSDHLDTEATLDE